MTRTVDLRQHTVKSRRPGVGDDFGAFAKLVLLLNARLVAVGDALSAPVGQTSARWMVLASIEIEPKAVANIARSLSLTRQSVQRVADLLEEDRLAEYQENPNHLRAKLLTITPRGRGALGEIQSAWRDWADNVGRRIGDRNLKAASTILERALRAAGEEPPRIGRTK